MKLFLFSVVSFIVCILEISSKSSIGGDRKHERKGSHVHLLPPRVSVKPETSMPAKADTRMTKLIQQNQAGLSLTKSVFSSESRLLFVAGLEGTGHHALSNMFRECTKDGLCEPDNALAQASQQFNVTIWSMTGLFSGAGQDEMSDVTKLEKRMGELAAMKGNHLFLMGLEFTIDAGMMSYPNYDGKYKAMDNPDVFTLAMIAESVGLDFRVLVLQRSAEDILRSTINRGIGASSLGVQGEPKVLIESANALFTQLLLLDKKFFECVKFEQLGSLTKTQKAALIDFLHPINLKTEFDVMLKKVEYHGANSTRHENNPYMDKLNPLNLRYQAMHLASRLALIDGLCKQT